MENSITTKTPKAITSKSPGPTPPKRGIQRMPQAKFAGISDEAIKAAGIRQVGANEAERLCGYSLPGFVIPYHTWSGKPVRRDCDGGRDYVRLRVANPAPGAPKYLSARETKIYAFLPPQLSACLGHFVPGSTIQRKPSETLTVVEGEKKALALCDAGIPAVGIPGIACLFQDGQLIPGLREVIKECHIKRVLFLGDLDTIFIYDFSRESVKLAKYLGLRDIKVALPRIKLDARGKGIDDIRGAIGFDAFGTYWEGLVEEAEPVGVFDTPGALFLRLLEREDPKVLGQLFKAPKGCAT